MSPSKLIPYLISLPLMRGGVTYKPHLGLARSLAMILHKEGKKKSSPFCKRIIGFLFHKEIKVMNPIL